MNIKAKTIKAESPEYTDAKNKTRSAKYSPVWVVANAKYKDSTLSGIGAEKVGGRWNAVGTRAVYCSENIALALLEYYLHSENIANLPKEILIAFIEIPNDFIIENLTELPKKWNQYPYAAQTTTIFTELAKDRNFFALRVPSTIVGLESNIILYSTR